jgi:hypothetical protein
MQYNRALLVEATLVDMADSEAEPAAEMARMQRLAATYARLPLGTALHTCGVCTEVGPDSSSGSLGSVVRDMQTVSDNQLFISHSSDS